MVISNIFNEQKKHEVKKLTITLTNQLVDDCLYILMLHNYLINSLKI